MCYKTVMKRIQRLRKMVTLAYNLEWIESISLRRWKTNFVKVDRDFLSENEPSNLVYRHPRYLCNELVVNYFPSIYLNSTVLRTLTRLSLGPTKSSLIIESLIAFKVSMVTVF